jgi:hypothetical protein
MTQHPIQTMLDEVAGGRIPSLNEIRSLGLPETNRQELEAAIRETENHGDPAKAELAAERLVARLPAGYDGDDSDLDPRALAARLPQT